MISTIKISRSSVFGSLKIDFGVLFLPVMLAIAFSQALNFTGPAEPPYWYFPFLITVMDTPHIICGYWVMFRQKDLPHFLRLKMAAWLGGFFLLYLYLLNNDHTDFALTFLALSSIWHFLRQHQAWFYLAMRGTANEGKKTFRINQLGIGAVTWGFFLIGQCSGDRDGWFAMNDLLLLPEVFKWPLSFVVVVCILVYLWHHIVLALQHREVALNAHMIWLSAVIVWGGTRLIEINYLSSALIIIPHAVSYVFLLQRYERNGPNSSRTFTPLMALLCVYILGMTFQGYRYLPLLKDGMMDEGSWIAALIMGASVAHYIHDKIFWNTQANPGWQKRI